MAELNIVEKVIALEAVELLQTLSPEQLSRLASIAREETIPPGKVVLDPAKPLDALYVVLDGAVELSRNDQPLHVARQNEVLGAWALFDEEPMPVVAKAVEDTKLLCIRREDFFELLSDNLEIAASIFSTLVKRFRKLLEH